jgi:hypothetical protein
MNQLPFSTPVTQGLPNPITWNQFNPNSYAGHLYQPNPLPTPLPAFSPVSMDRFNGVANVRLGNPLTPQPGSSQDLLAATKRASFVPSPLTSRGVPLFPTTTVSGGGGSTNEQVSQAFEPTKEALQEAASWAGPSMKGPLWTFVNSMNLWITAIQGGRYPALVGQLPELYERRAYWSGLLLHHGEAG